MVAPSQAFLDRLPYGKVPDRDDFKTFLGNDKERKRYWNKAVKESARMADELQELIESGKMRNAVQRF
ncbi:MAG: hypothetical protein BWX67_02344 [Thermotogae bacterium ADurb.Bin062]|nr:MAG: hypothetical protein BWX67_02344 [Thermotogota bacterium ADurb.Bin062]